MAEAPTTRVELPVHTMFSVTNAYNVGGEIVFGLLRDPVTADISDSFYTVTQGLQNRLDVVSQTVYGTPTLWWVIAMVNNIIDPALGVPINTKLRIPSRARLASAGVLN